VQLKKSSHQILVIGHTDNKPIGPALVKHYPTNWELAGARAASVVRLFAHSGLPSKRLLAVSMADAQPVASNSTPEGRARNRRIEIRLRPVPAED
jgi:chemotaxis protein MotB